MTPEIKFQLLSTTEKGLQFIVTVRSTEYDSMLDIEGLDVFLSVHLSINLVNDQLDAQFFYFIIRLLQFSTCFEQRRAHHQEVKLY